MAAEYQRLVAHVSRKQPGQEVDDVSNVQAAPSYRDGSLSQRSRSKSKGKSSANTGGMGYAQRSPKTAAEFKKDGVARDFRYYCAGGGGFANKLLVTCPDRPFKGKTLKASEMTGRGPAAPGSGRSTSRPKSASASAAGVYTVPQPHRPLSARAASQSGLSAGGGRQAHSHSALSRNGGGADSSSGSNFREGGGGGGVGGHSSETLRVLRQTASMTNARGPGGGDGSRPVAGASRSDLAGSPDDLSSGLARGQGGGGANVNMTDMLDMMREKAYQMEVSAENERRMQLEWADDRKRYMSETQTLRHELAHMTAERNRAVKGHDGYEREQRRLASEVASLLAKLSAKDEEMRIIMDAHSRATEKVRTDEARRFTELRVSLEFAAPTRPRT